MFEFHGVEGRDDAIACRRCARHSDLERPRIDDAVAQMADEQHVEVGEIVFLVFYKKVYFLGAFLQDFILFFFTLAGYFLLLLGFKEAIR